MTECDKCKSNMLEIPLGKDWKTLTCLHCNVANWIKSSPLTESDKSFLRCLSVKQVPHD